MVLSKSQLSPTEETMDIDIDSTTRQFSWLLTDLPGLPMFQDVRLKTCNALRQVSRLFDLKSQKIATEFELLQSFGRTLSVTNIDIVLLDKINKLEKIVSTLIRSLIRVYTIFHSFTTFSLNSFIPYL